jgi:hypothetical protein
MANRRAWHRLGPRALGLGLLAGALALGGALALVAGSAPAGAAGSPPGPLSTLQPGQWIAFTVSSSNGQTGTITTQVGNANAGGANPAPPFFTSADWPTEWSANGVTLTYSGPSPGCPSTDSSCGPFTISGSPGSHPGVIFEAGPVPDSVTQSGDPNAWTVVIPEPTTTTTLAPPPPPAPPNATFNGPPNGQLTGPGAFSFTAPTQTGQGPYSYAWTLTSNGQPVDSGTQASYTPPASIFSAPTATYTLSLKVTDGLGNSVTNSAQFEVVTQVGKTPPPQTPSSPPAAGGTPAPPLLGRTSLNAVTYVPQLAHFATPTPGALQPVTVIWLWRPNWFQATETAKTDGRPKAVKRADVSVDPAGKGGQSATLPLAGLATFGIFGIGWVLFKRRRVRSALLD